MVANKKMTKQEILKQIKLEEEKIKSAKQRKESYVYQASNKPTVVKTTSSGKKLVSKPKRDERIEWTYVSPNKNPDERYDYETIDKYNFNNSSSSAVQSNTSSSIKTSTNTSTKKEVGKIFYVCSILAGIALIAVIVVIMCAIILGWV